MQNLSEDEQRGVGIVDWRAEEKVNAVVGPLLEKVNFLEQQWLPITPICSSGGSGIMLLRSQKRKRRTRRMKSITTGR